jgi:hypothetical protein
MLFISLQQPEGDESTYLLLLTTTTTPTYNRLRRGPRPVTRFGTEWMPL